MTTDDIYAAAENAVRESDRRWWDDPQEVTATSQAEDWARRIRAAVDAAAPLLIAQGRREAAEAIRDLAQISMEDSDTYAVGWRVGVDNAARIAEGGTP